MSQDTPALRRMLKLVNYLMSRPDSGPFREPVDWRGLELLDYPKIIKRLMDLGSVKRKLERGIYKSHKECADDVRLIWDNCMTYNADDSDFWRLAKAFSKKFEEKYKKIQVEFGDEEEETSTTSAAGGAVLPAKSEMMLISQDRKSKFAAAIFMLNGMELGHVIRTMELECPTALEDLDGEAKVEINVNALDSKTFIELEKYVQDKMSETKSPPAVATTTTTTTTAAVTTARPNKKRKK